MLLRVVCSVVLLSFSVSLYVWLPCSRSFQTLATLANVQDHSGVTAMSALQPDPTPAYSASSEAGTASTAAASTTAVVPFTSETAVQPAGKLFTSAKKLGICSWSRNVVFLSINYESSMSKISAG